MTPAEDSIRVARSKRTVYVEVGGLGTMHNCKTLQEFANEEIARGRKKFLFDLSRCRGMDSTFMGTLIGIGSQLGDLKSVIVLNPSAHALAQMRSLGLHELLLIQEGTTPPRKLEMHSLKSVMCSQKEMVQLIYDAHKTLVKLDKRNERKFKAFLKGLAREIGR